MTEPADDIRSRDTLDDPVEAAASSPRQRASRAFQLGAFALLAAAGGLVVASSAPAVAREMGVTDVRVVTRDFARSAPAGQAGVDAVRDFEKGIGRSVAELELDDEDEDWGRKRAMPTGEGGAQIAVALRDVALREDPKRSSPELSSVKKGQALVVLRQERDWVMVVRKANGEGIEVGWVPERDVTIP